MNTAKVIGITKPLVEGIETAEDFIVYVARVSNPSNQFNLMTGSKLLKYLIANRHWSPFEQVHITMDISTTRDIAHQIVRHRSFSFQEFSQRYADPTKDMGFVTREARLQDHKNRQNSIDVEDIADFHTAYTIRDDFTALQYTVIEQAKVAYNEAIKRGIAKEQARAVLPEGLTKTRLYMSGTLRSWIHYIDVRAEEGTQKEHREIAIQAREEILKQFPSLRDYWFEQEIKETLEKSPRDWWWKFWS